MSCLNRGYELVNCQDKYLSAISITVKNYGTAPSNEVGIYKFCRHSGSTRSPRYNTRVK